MIEIMGSCRGAFVWQGTGERKSILMKLNKIDVAMAMRRFTSK